MLPSQNYTLYNMIHLHIVFSNDDILETQQLLENETEKQVVESNTDAEFTCGDDEYDDTKALLLETELKKLTNGKILTIDQVCESK